MVSIVYFIVFTYIVKIALRISFFICICPYFQYSKEAPQVYMYL